MARLALGLALASLALGCAGPGERRVRHAVVTTSCGATVVDCLPLGAVDLLAIDLDASRSSEATRSVVAAAAPVDVAAFSRTFGFEPGAVHAIALARYQPGTLYVLEGDFRAADIVEHLGERMSTVEIRDASPPRRIGFVGVERVDVAAVGPHRLAIGQEHGAPMMRLLARVAGRLVPSTLERMPASLAQELRAGPVAGAFFMPGRFPLESEVGTLFARTEWVGMRARSSASGGLGLTVGVHGRLPASADENLRALAAEVAETEVGGAFGIRSALPTLNVGASDDGMVLDLELDPRRVAFAVGTVLGREDVGFPPP